MPRIFFLLIIVFTAQTVSSQIITGSWYGRADVVANGVTNNYLTELILKQKGDEVEGIFGYYFKDSYQSFFIRGSYDKKTRLVHIKDIPILYFRSETRNGIECPMRFEGTLMISRVSSSLTGSFISEDKYKYTCPELKVRFALDAKETDLQDSLLKHTVVGQKLWQPLEEDFVISSNINQQNVTVRPGQAPPLTDTAQVVPAAPETVAQLAADNKDLIAAFEKRHNTYSHDLEIEGDSIRVSFYDNGDIDGDTISVFLNKKPVLVKQEITARALNIYLALDSNKSVNELSMFAENLGKFPPNTALMIVTDGINRYEVYLSSSLTQNAAIRLRRKKKK